MNNHVHRAPFSDIERKREVAKSKEHTCTAKLIVIKWVYIIKFPLHAMLRYAAHVMDTAHVHASRGRWAPNVTQRII